VTARIFEDSLGAVWEVFEVRRSTQKPGAVTSGLEHGWLAFVSGETKRRLAPFPPEWETAAVPELQRLCAMAHAVSTPRFPLDEETRLKRRAARAAEATVAPPTHRSVEETVRTFAHEARSSGLAAIEAMLRLKALLHATYPEPDSEARDIRRVRRWFVEAYYFERDV
jgi:hypothetical protein